jgi:hypothetical protein
MAEVPRDDDNPAENPPSWQPPSDPPPQYDPPQYQPPPYGAPQQYGQPQYLPPPGYQPPGYQPPGYQPQYSVPAFGPPPADKPGVIPLRPLAVGEVLDGAFASIRMNPKAMLGLSFVVVLIGQVAILGINLGVRDASTGTRLLGALATGVVALLQSSIVTGAIIIVIGEAVLGTRISPAEALRRLEGRIWKLVGLGLLVGLLVVLAAILLVIPGIYLAVALLFATPAFVLEKTTVREALGRSRELVRGSWWRTFGIALLGYLVALVIGGVIEIPFALGAASSAGVFSGTTSSDVSTGSEILLTVGRIIGGTFTTPMIAGTIALMYIDRRIRREGLDLALAQTARERRGGS